VITLLPMKRYVLGLASLFFTSAHAQWEPAVQPQRIKVLSWNIYMLPGFLSIGTAERSLAIGSMLSSGEYDVIVFQEAFHAAARKKIRDQLKHVYRYEAGPANASRFSLRTNSGLWIWSKHPIVMQQEIMFRTRYGVDAMSRKGGLLIELDVRGCRVQVVATHLQNAGRGALKQMQCEELFARLLAREQREGVPQIICGDFNVDRHHAPDAYQGMLASLDVNDGELAAESFSYDRITNDLNVEPGDQRELIDFIFIRENTSIVTRLTYAVKRFRFKWHTKHEDLSDHYALESEIDLYPASSLPAMAAKR
jgi:endonuclease/exonuclease/phosphatase family metal-dependent hydrolase